MSGSATTACLSRTAITLVLLLLMLAGPSSANAREPTNLDRAIELYNLSLQRYREGRFEEAADLLREVYKTKPEPVLQYNLGRACEGMGDLACAVEAYARYVRDEPGAPDRSAIEQRIRTLRHQLRERGALERERDKGGRSPKSGLRAADRESGEQTAVSAVPWLITGLGVAGLGSGIVLATMAQQKHEDAIDDPVQQSAAAKQAQAENLATAANIAIVSGSLLALGGVAWGIWDVTQSRARISRGKRGVELRVGLARASVLVTF